MILHVSSQIPFFTHHCASLPPKIIHVPYFWSYSYFFLFKIHRDSADNCVYVDICRKELGIITLGRRTNLSTPNLS